jgi:hypothetical protein
MAVKYETLRDAASAGKESNFDQLKKRTEQTAKGRHCIRIVLFELTNMQIKTRSSKP